MKLSGAPQSGTIEPLAPTSGISSAPLDSFLNYDPFRLASVPYQVTTYLFPSRATPICPQAAVLPDIGGRLKAGHQRPAIRGTKRYGKSSRSSAEASSLRLDVGCPDHLGPLFGFLCDKLAKVGG